MKTKIISAVALLLTICPAAFGMGRKPVVPVDNNSPCFTGTDEEKQSQAQQIFLALLTEALPRKDGKAVMPNSNEKVSSEFTQDMERHFFHLLASEMEKHGCAFSKNAKFDTVGETLNSIANDSYKITQAEGIPQWMKPGFRAVMGGYDNNNTIFIETTTSGFVFHACEHDTNTPGNDAPAPTEACPTLFNRSLYVPVDEFLENSSGLQHKVLMVLKSLAATSVIITSNLGLSIISPVASAVVNLTNPDPIGVMRRDQTVNDATIAFLKFGAHSSALNDNNIVTQLLPSKYDDIKQALTDVVGQIFSKEYNQLDRINSHPNDPNLELMPAEQMETDFHARVQKQYNDAKAASSQPAAPVDSLPASKPN